MLTLATVRREHGFSMPELLVATGLLLVISSAVTSGLLQLSHTQRRISQRVDMHAGVRSATEILQQEVGQAGRVSLPGTAVLSGGVLAGPQTVGITQKINGVTAASAAGFFVGELLTIDPGNVGEEVVAVSAVDTASKQITATFLNPHTGTPPVIPVGGFATGIVPPQPAFTNGSTGNLLKLYGDVNGDGNMVYVEYVCDTAGGNFYRNVMAFDSATKVTLSTSQVLLTNITPNPGGVACFTYGPVKTVGSATYVLDVAITLTVKTAALNQQTGTYDTETKALLNVSPRNVFNVWELASAGVATRIQPMPPTVTNLIALPTNLP
jgi:prepilin-type N-terminal cleavage/methylation domain-containing protein